MGAEDTEETRGQAVTHYLVQRPGCVSTQFHPLSLIFYLLSKAWVLLNSQNSFFVYIISLNSMPLNRSHHSDVIIQDHHSRLASVSELELKLAISEFDIHPLGANWAWPINVLANPMFR